MPTPDLRVTLYRMAIRIALGYWILLFLLSCSGPGQRRNDEDNDRSCREFVQGFFDWYVPNAAKDNKEAGWDLAMKDRPNVFTAELLQQLTADSQAQHKAADIVGLDFDPFLNCQDCGERYVVGNVTVTAAKCSTEVYGVWSGKKNDKPNVVPELIGKDGKWLFVDFHYPNPSGPEFESLLRQLKTLRDLRENAPK